LGYDASGILRYLARLEVLPGPYSEALDLTRYLVRNDAVAAVAFKNFNTEDLAGMARELEGDALRASSRVGSPWIHGCAGIKVSPADFDGRYDRLLDLGHDLMKLFGVSHNRYFLAVHADSEHIHVHFLYSRIGPNGALRERDRRQPKFMAEEATALLAHRYGFELEDHHLSRIINGEVVDLASRKVVRDRTFREVPAGMKQRNEARKKVGKNQLYKLALASDFVAEGDIDHFRWILARHGVLFEPRGTGAEFVDVDESRVPASDLDYRFFRGRILGGACGTSLAPTPPEILQLARFRRPLPHDPKAEIARFMADREDLPAAQTVDEDRWDRAVRRSMSSDRRGAPPLSPDLPGWPERMKVTGTIGASSGKAGRVRFPPPYDVREGERQTEIWNGNLLIATVRYSRMAILSKREDDLRASLLAAQAAWGTVEIFGNPKFKKRMVALAAELNLPISNPELADAIAAARAERTTAAPVKVTETKIDVREPALPTEPVKLTGKPAAEQNRSPHPDGTEGPMRPEVTTNTPAPCTKPEEVPIAPEPVANPTLRDEPATAMASLSAELYATIKQNSWELMPTDRGGLEFTVVEPQTMRAFSFTEEDLSGFRMQLKLRTLLKQQQAEKATILRLIAEGLGKTRPAASPYGRAPARMNLQTDNQELSDLFKQYQHHHDLHASLDRLFQQQCADHAKAEKKRLGAIDKARSAVRETSSIDKPVSAEQARLMEQAESAPDPIESQVTDLEKASLTNIVVATESSSAELRSKEHSEKVEMGPNIYIAKGEPSPPEERQAVGAETTKHLQNEDAESLKHQERLAEIRMPRVFGLQGGIVSAGVPVPLPLDEPLKLGSKNTSLAAVKEQPPEPPRVDAHTEAAKAAAVVGKQK
jgi:hypothetical protein